ncbi:MAG: DivIVA domain-containing protein [Bacteroidia bacterium]|nr:DivIVA domain-containing protein [Bacteroidia bacterium]
MKITPLEIRQKAFEKALRGFDKDEVNAFLLSLSQEWERSLDETKELRIKYETSEREVSKLREVENSLYKTLKTAEDTGANVIGQANKAAELHMRETQLKAEGMLNEAKVKAKDTLELAEATSKQMLEEMEDRLKSLVQQYKGLETYRDNLLSDLKRMAGETIDRVERMRTVAREFDPEQHLNMAKRESKKALYPNADFENSIKKTASAQQVLAESVAAVLVEEKKVQKSFFDDIQ